MTNKLVKFLKIVYLVHPNLLTMDILEKLLKNINNIIKNFNPDEKIIIKNSLEYCVGFILLEFGIDKMVDVIISCFKK